MHYALHTMHMRFCLCAYKMGYPDEKTCCVRCMRIAEYMEKKEYIWCCGLYKGRFLSFCSFAFCPNEGGGGPARIFCYLFISGQKFIAVDEYFMATFTNKLLLTKYCQFCIIYKKMNHLYQKKAAE